MEKKKEVKANERGSGKSTSTQDTGPKNQVNEQLRGDDYTEETSRLEGDELKEADGEQKGNSGRSDE